MYLADEAVPQASPRSGHPSISARGGFPRHSLTRIWFRWRSESGRRSQVSHGRRHRLSVPRVDRVYDAIYYSFNVHVT